jgi:hypothetical protein
MSFNIHRSRGECLLGLVEISQCHGDLTDTMEHWKMARALFERSAQTKQVADIDERLERISAMCSRNIKEISFFSQTCVHQLASWKVSKLLEAKAVSAMERRKIRIWMANG